MRRSRPLLAFALCLLLAAPQASADVDRSPQLIDTIRSEQARIRSAAEAGSGPYKDLSQDKRNELLRKQAQMLALLEGKQSTEDLSEEQKTEVFNTLEWIEAVVNQAEDDRLICERRAILGSNRKERVCRTAAQLQAEREAARNQIDSRGLCSDCRSN